MHWFHPGLGGMGIHYMRPHCFRSRAHWLFLGLWSSQHIPICAFSAAGETPHQQLRSRKPKRQELSPTEHSDLCPPPETSEAQPFMTPSSWAWLPLLRASPLPGSSSRPLSAPDAPSSEPPQHRTEPHRIALISFPCLGVGLTHLE